MANEFWVNGQQWSAIEPPLPHNQPGARRVDDRRVISGIVHVLKVGCRWEDCPALYGPSTTIYNRFNRWSRRGLWQRLFEALVRSDGGDTQMIDSTTAKAHRSAGGGKGGLGAGDRSLARWADDEDPRGRRLPRQIDRLRDHTGPARRCACRRGAVGTDAGGPTVHRRHRLRQRCATPLPERTRHPAGDPQQPDP